MVAKPLPRHEVISLRLNEDRLALLERHRAALTAQLGRDVSLAEAAFLVFEDRAPQIDRAASRHELLQTPTASLERIRKRWASEHALSGAEWDVVADYVLISTEEERQEPPMLQPAVPSRTSYGALLDAFEAVYRLATPGSQNAWAYFSHLGGLETSARLCDADAGQRHKAVLAQIALCRTRLQSDDSWARPGNVGRCLLMAIRDEGIDGVSLDRTLAPYWPVLWGLAARGHWIRHERQPVRSSRPMDDDLREQIRLPDAMAVGEITLSCTGVGRPELAVVIDFGATRGVSVVLSRYPELVEFRAMLDGVRDRVWNGRHFRTSVAADPKATTFSLTLKASDVRLELHESEWLALRDLFRDAWQRPELARWLSALAQEYGEQG
jgi:hypothetical protein